MADMAEELEADECWLAGGDGEGEGKEGGEVGRGGGEEEEDERELDIDERQFRTFIAPLCPGFGDKRPAADGRSGKGRRHSSTTARDVKRDAGLPLPAVVIRHFLTYAAAHFSTRERFSFDDMIPRMTREVRRTAFSWVPLGRAWSCTVESRAAAVEDLC